MHALWCCAFAVMCFIAPVEGVEIRHYAQRFDFGYHTGVDWYAPYGTRVLAAADGVVVYSGRLAWGADRGVIVLRHDLPTGGTLYTFYGHVDALPGGMPDVGQFVRCGMPIAIVGRPATSTTHLHFELRTEWNDVEGGYWYERPSDAHWLNPALLLGHCVWEANDARDFPAGME